MRKAEEKERAGDYSGAEADYRDALALGERLCARREDLVLAEPAAFERLPEHHPGASSEVVPVCARTEREPKSYGRQGMFEDLKNNP